MFVFPAGLTCANDKASVRKTSVFTKKRFFINEMNRSVILIKIIRHLFDFSFNASLICAVFHSSKNLTGVFLASCQRRPVPAAHGLQCGLYGNRILSGVHDAFDSADCIGMSLTDSFPPKSVIAAVWQDTFCV